MSSISLHDFLTGIANAIRYAENSTGEINAMMFESRIRALTSASNSSDSNTGNTGGSGTGTGTSDNTSGTGTGDNTDNTDSGSGAENTDSGTGTGTSDNTGGSSGGSTSNSISVPQTGTWQYKTTPAGGFIILGKDDDTADQAMFVRMINGYGFPVTINTSYESQYDLSKHNLKSDSDTEYSQYPANSVSRFPNGGTVHDLNMIILDNNLGEVAQHGSSNYSIWDSSTLSSSVLDELYEAYTTGGGTKTKDELLQAMRELYASTDASQGASYIDTCRASLEADLNHVIYTLGCWGSSGNIVVDDIIVGPRSKITVGSSGYARQHNYYADGPVTSFSPSYVRDPYKITRYSAGLSSVENVTTTCTNAYTNRCCIEIFSHLFFTGYGTESEWTLMKNMLDTVKTWVDAGKIQVVTRYQYSQLGEFVDNPIVSVSISCNKTGYTLNDSVSENDFICKATLQDGTEVTCSNDRIIDTSNIDTTEEGVYTVGLNYRGFYASTSVLVVETLPTTFLIQESSVEITDFTSTKENKINIDVVNIEIGKKYRLMFNLVADCETRYAIHYLEITASQYGGTAWATGSTTYNTSAGKLDTVIILDLTATSTHTGGPYGQTELINIKRQNTDLTNIYAKNILMWELPDEEE